jgi:Zn-dependent M28 family amino/carboxypeptidase
VVLSCEDYGLVYRLAERRQAPVLRLEADADFDRDVPVYNVIAEIRGTARPDEYVMLSAHFDSWDGASGTTDNGTGTVVMLEAMRILRVAYPNPKRTILVGHWSGEEQGLNGSHAFVEDHPEIVSGLQALFNQDDGTGRTASIQASGFVSAGEHLAWWVSRVPTELSQGMALLLPGVPAGGGTDNAAFVCAGAPGFGLNSESAEYSTYTHHTNRDTYDKVIPEHLRFKAMLVAMLVYLAAEDSQKVSRDRRIMPLLEGGGQEWPACKKAARSRAESDR